MKEVTALEALGGHSAVLCSYGGMMYHGGSVMGEKLITDKDLLPYFGSLLQLSQQEKEDVTVKCLQELFNNKYSDLVQEKGRKMPYMKLAQLGIVFQNLPDVLVQEIGLVPRKPTLYGSSQRRKLWASRQIWKLGVSITTESTSAIIQTAIPISTNHQPSTTITPPTSITPSTAIIPSTSITSSSSNTACTSTTAYTTISSSVSINSSTTITPSTSITSSTAITASTTITPSPSIASSTTITPSPSITSSTTITSSTSITSSTTITPSSSNINPPAMTPIKGRSFLSISSSSGTVIPKETLFGMTVPYSKDTIHAVCLLCPRVEIHGRNVSPGNVVVQVVDITRKGLRPLCPGQFDGDDEPVCVGGFYEWPSSQLYVL